MSTPVRSHWILRHRRAIVLAALAASVGLGAQLPRLRFDYSPQHIFERGDDPEMQRWRATAAEFGRADDWLYVVLEAPASDSVLTPSRRRYLAALGEALAARPWCKRLRSLATVEIPVDSPSGLLARPALDLDAASLAAHPLIGGQLLSADGGLTVVALELRREFRLIDGLRQSVGDAEQWIAVHPAPPETQVHLAGVPFIRTSVVRALQADMLRFIPAGILLVCLLLLISFRSLSLLLVPLLSVGVALLWSGGATVLAGVPVDIVNNVLPILILVVGLSDVLHLVSRYRSELVAGHPREVALSRTARALLVACFLTSATTAVGFSSLAVSSAPIIQRFGLLAAASVGLAYVATAGLMPALLSYARPPSVPRDRVDRLGLLARACAAVGVRWPRAITAAFTVGALGLGALGVSRVEANIHLLDFFPQGHDNRRVLAALEEHLGGIIAVDVVVRLPTPEGLEDPGMLRRLARAQREILTVEGVSAARSAADLVAALHRAVAGAHDPQSLPSDRPQLAQELLLADLGGVALPLDGFVSRDRRDLRLEVRVRDLGGRAWLRISGDVLAAARAAFADVPGAEVFVTGDAHMVARNTTAVINDLVQSLALAAAVIFLCLAALLRDLRLALVSVLPNVLPLLLTAGVMGALGLDLMLSTAVVFTISLGLAVDDTIHVLARFREEAAAGGEVRATILRAAEGSGRAVILTSALLTAALLLLTTSSFVPTRQFGALTCVTLCGALIADLFLLPALLSLAYGARFSRRPGGAWSTPAPRQPVGQDPERC